MPYHWCTCEGAWYWELYCRAAPVSTILIEERGRSMGSSLLRCICMPLRFMPILLNMTRTDSRIPMMRTVRRSRSSRGTQATDAVHIFRNVRGVSIRMVGSRCMVRHGHDTYPRL